MKRWSPLVLLLLLPFTLAPRTSINPGGELVLTQMVSRTQIRPGSAVTFVLQARNATTSPLTNAQVEILVGWNVKNDIHLVATKSCVTNQVDDGYLVSCRFGTLDAGERRTVKVTARPLTDGVLTFTPGGVSMLAPAEPVEVVVRGRG